MARVFGVIFRKGMRLMKSFGVRLGAGVVTIAFAAYVAIISQKSDPENVAQWTAEKNLDQSPVNPLGAELTADSLDSGWLKQPTIPMESSSSTQEPKNLASTRSSLIPEVGQSDASVGDLQLVQHEEDGQEGGVATAFSSESAFPDTPSFAGGTPSALAPKAADEDTSWLLPTGEAEVENASGDTAVSGGFRFPADRVSDGDEPSNGNLLAVPSLTGAYPGSPESGDVESGESVLDAGVALAEQEATGVEAIFAAENGTASITSGNILRGELGESNALRGGESPADLGFTLSDMPMDSASTETVDSGVGSGIANTVSASSLAPSTNTDAAIAGGITSGGSARLPSVSQLNQQPVGNGLRASVGGESDTSGVASINNSLGEVVALDGPSSAFESPGDGIPATAQTTPATAAGNALTADGLEGLRDESPLASELSAGVENRMNSEMLNPVQQSPVGEIPDVSSPYSALEVASAAPQLGSAVSVGSTFGGERSVADMRSQAAASATMDAPGERRLEGAQSPSVVIQKRAPSEVRVGKTASFVVNVQNVGVAEALNVEVYDRIPAGMRFVEATPAAKQVGGLLLWELGTMKAGEERTITIQLVPEQEGELGSVARVSFEAAASVRTLSTKPELKIVQRVPERGVLIGQQLEIEIEVSNPGSGSAVGVILQEDVPEGLEHPRGRQLDNALGTLAPGEIRRQTLRLRAVKPGVVENTIRLVSDDGLETEHTVAVQVIAPNLQVQLNGPSRRFLERPATYELQVANQGTADATNLEIAVHLDRGFTFVSTENEGYYDPNRHAVFWSLAQLPAGSMGTVPLTLLPVEAGEQAIRIEADGDLGVSIASQRTMTVEGFAELTFAVANPGGPIEIGAETEYEVTVTNTGSMADQNVRIQLQLPAGLELISTSADAGTNGQGLVAFQEIRELQPNQTVKQTIRARGLSPGVHVVKAVVVSDQSSVPLTKEESTRVYADQ